MTYLDTLLSHGQLPLITLPSRITPTTATNIDHISTTYKSDCFDSGLIHSSLSDHLPIFYIKHVNSASSKPKYMKTRKINTETISSFENLLKTVNWDSVLTENRPAYAFSKYFEIMDNCVDVSFPEYPCKINPQKVSINPWMTKGLLTSRRHKEKLFSKKISNPNDSNIVNFKKI